jgi:UDP-4-amino-4,6-dideoxy-N-acetyl-beta-L-altrosamine N-acetyltransferase
MIHFRQLQESDMELVLEWRTSPRVSNSMFTEVPLSLEKQIKWFKKIAQDESVQYWIVSFNLTPIGVVNLAEIDHDNRRCTAGYYIGDINFKGLGAMIPPYLYNHIFRELGFNKIYGLVLSDNLNILKIHKYHGFKVVGVLESHTLKENSWKDVVVIELLAKNWLNLERFRRDIAIFPHVEKLNELE